MASGGGVRKERKGMGAKREGKGEVSHSHYDRGAENIQTALKCGIRLTGND